MASHRGEEEDREPYELIVFKGDNLYIYEKLFKQEAVKEFLGLCKDCISPEYYEENETEFKAFNGLLYYMDKSGGHKPFRIMLVGYVGPIISEIRDGLEKFYPKFEVFI